MGLFARWPGVPALWRIRGRRCVRAEIRNRIAVVVYAPRSRCVLTHSRWSD